MAGGAVGFGETGPPEPIPTVGASDACRCDAAWAANCAWRWSSACLRGLGRLQVGDLALDRAEQLLALAELALDRGARRIPLRHDLHLLGVGVLQEPLPVLHLAAEARDLLDHERVLLARRGRLASIRPSMSSRLEAPSSTARPAFWSPDV